VDTSPFAEVQATDATITTHEDSQGENLPVYTLCLYISGMSPRSVAAQKNLRVICEKYLKGRYALEVIDVLKQPERAVEAKLIAAPTLIKVSPPPVRKFVGDLADTERVLAGLDLLK
jgi:circadian clock protein KaiB